MRGTSHRISSSSHPKHPGHPWDHYGPTVSLPSQSSGQSLKILKIRILKYYLDLFGYIWIGNVHLWISPMFHPFPSYFPIIFIHSPYVPHIFPPALTGCQISGLLPRCPQSPPEDSLSPASDGDMDGRWELSRTFTWFREKPPWFSRTMEIWMADETSKLLGLLTCSLQPPERLCPKNIL